MKRRRPRLRNFVVLLYLPHRQMLGEVPIRDFTPAGARRQAQYIRRGIRTATIDATDPKCKALAEAVRRNVVGTR